MADSEWNTDFDHRVIELLQSDRFAPKQEHHFGRPFASAYQIAAAFQEEHDDICKKYNKGMTGDYEGMSNLQTYIANQLSQHIKSDPDGYPVEAVWLSANGLADLHYRRDSKTVTGGPNSEHNAFSLYRIKE